MGNKIVSIDIENNATEILMTLPQGGGGRGLTYNYDNHSLILTHMLDDDGDFGNGYSPKLIASVDLNTNTYSVLVSND